MRMITDTSWLRPAAQPTGRSGFPSLRGGDFSSVLQAASPGGSKVADVSASGELPVASGTGMGPGGNAQGDASGAQAAEPVQWLASQLFAYKVKGPVQSVNYDGSVTNSVTTSVVTLPRTAPGPDAPGISGAVDPSALDLASLLTGKTTDPTGSTDPINSTGATDPTDLAGTDGSGTVSVVDPNKTLQVDTTDPLQTEAVDPQQLETVDTQNPDLTDAVTLG